MFPYFTVDMLRAQEIEALTLLVKQYPQFSWVLIIPQSHLDQIPLQWLANEINSLTGATPPLAPAL